MQLFYSPTLEATATTFTFEKEESKHIIKVLRKKRGDLLHVTNGKGYQFQTELTDANEKKCVVQIISYDFESPKPYRIHLAVAPTKMNERYEWFLEKATEMGIDEITPIICDHSERKIVKTERFEKIIQAAMKQSLHSYLPKLNDAVPLKTFLAKENKDTKFIAHCEKIEKKLLKNAIESNQSYTLLIGPEGDFSSSEISLALKSDYQAVSLGNSRLRTETAALVAVHSFVFHHE